LRIGAFHFPSVSLKFLQASRRAPGRPPLQLILWWTGVRSILWLLFKLFYRIKTFGSENVPATGPIIYVSNHQSHFDPIIVGLPVGDRPFSGMARATLFQNKLLAWVMRSIGAVELDRDRPDASAMKKALEELQAGRCVLIFPEGTRTRDGRIGEFQRGAMLLIKRSGAKVVPVALEGAFDLWPTGQKYPKLRGRIAVQVAPPISAEELLRAGPDAGLDQLRSAIQKMCDELRATLQR
jgi:1-acyl-sn-glycerol-3-phosphate acyltransferase